MSRLDRKTKMTLLKSIVAAVAIAPFGRLAQALQRRRMKREMNRQGWCVY